MDKNAGKSVASISSPSTSSATVERASTANARTLSTQDQNNPNNNDDFKRTLSIFDMVIYGLIFMVPIAPFSIYGGVANASNGMASMAYLIAFVAMFFTVLSFGIMIKTFPSSGSSEPRYHFWLSGLLGEVLPLLGHRDASRSYGGRSSLYDRRRCDEIR